MITPVQDKVWIRPIFDAPKSKSGLIIIPDEARERCDQGIVKLIGPECKYVKVGDYVLFPNYTGQLMAIEGEPYIIMREDYVTSILNAENIEIPGLFLREVDDRTDANIARNGEVPNYFPATFDTVFQLVAEAMSTHPLFMEIREKKNKRQVNES